MKSSSKTLCQTQESCIPSISFEHPEKKIKILHPSLPVFPVFMPFAGCKNRCVFCSQELQTGIESIISPSQIVKEVDKNLSKRDISQPVELAFYGGTFTALPMSVQDAFLDLAEFWKKRGIVKAVRCSTRPDAVTEEGLLHLAKRGMSLVEFGVQSFDACALSLSGRPYSFDCVVEACRLVRKTGMSLGIQLMPGMPGVDLSIAKKDIQKTVALAPDVVRIYPCLVIEGTELASWWRKGVYSPWSLEQTKDFLAESLRHFWDKGIPVIRMGVAPSDGLDGSILAGPVHPSLGSMARGVALYSLVERYVHELMVLLENPLEASSSTTATPTDTVKKEKSGQAKIRTRLLSLSVPRKYQGEFFGYRGELKARYEELGFPPFSKVWQATLLRSKTSDHKAGITFHDNDTFVLTFAP